MKITIDLTAAAVKNLEVLAIVQRASIEQVAADLIIRGLAVANTRPAAVWPRPTEQRILKGAK
jgi:hypothetical protein